jgi:DNA-binding transcriptional regulator LsrR (DeoR family)
MSMRDLLLTNRDTLLTVPFSPEKSKGLEASELFDPTVRAAWLYYHEGLTQAEIATLLRVSRPSVANLLARAREEGVVTISLRADYLSSLTLAKIFKEQFGLKDVLVVPTPPSADTSSIHQSLGKAGALYLEKTLNPGDVLATAWGAAMLEVALALSGVTVDNLTIAQSLGGLSTADSFNPNRVASIMADKLGARVYHLYVPAVVESVAVRDILLRDPSIRSAFEVAKAATSVMLGIGKVSHDATVVRAGFITPIQIDELKAKGAVGDIAGRFFDVDGKPVVTELNERIIALSLEDIKTMNPVIAVVGGKDKVKPILGALRGGYIDVLILDERTAKDVLTLDKQKERK